MPHICRCRLREACGRSYRGSQRGLWLQKPLLPASTFGTHCSRLAYWQSQYTSPVPKEMTAHHGALPTWAMADVIPDAKLRSKITAENVSFIFVSPGARGRRCRKSGPSPRRRYSTFSFPLFFSSAKGIISGRSEKERKTQKRLALGPRRGSGSCSRVRKR